MLILLKVIQPGNAACRVIAMKQPVGVVSIISKFSDTRSPMQGGTL